MPHRMLTAEKQVRLFDVARAFQVLASHPASTLELARKIEDDTLTTAEAMLQTITSKMNGDPVAAEMRVLMSHPFAESPPLQVIHARDLAAEGEAPSFEWKSVEKPNAALGDKNAAFECAWGGLSLKIEKRGPADYEGFIDGQHFARSKFKKSMRERLEKEAAKRVNA